MNQMAKKSKFGNEKVCFGNEEFDSRGEMRRYLVLLDAVRRGAITNLRRQVKYILVPQQFRTVEIQLKTKVRYEQRQAEPAVTYTADFVYEKDGRTVVEDYKGYPNDRWPIKRALMLHVHGIAVREVKKPTEKV